MLPILRWIAELVGVLGAVRLSPPKPKAAVAEEPAPSCGRYIHSCAEPTKNWPPSDEVVQS